VPTEAATEDESERVVRFSILFGCMLAELMLSPFFGTTAAGFRTERILGVAILLAGLAVIGVGRGTIVLFIAALIAQLVTLRSNAPSAFVAAAMLRLLFFSCVTVVIVWRVLHEPGVTMDTIAGAACAYMLLGFVWAQVYMLLEYARPGAFAIPDSFLIGRDPAGALVYFSFTTLTSVGYGDIHPNDVGAGGISAAEAVVGQLYLAIMIGRMVGLQVGRRKG
jgi:hypothetical protein